MKRIGIGDIDLEDERFRICPFFSLEELILSIREIGLINPPVVTSRNGRFLLVTGWKRILACRALSLSRLPVFLLEEPDDLKAFRVSFLENLTVRHFSLIEKAEIIRKLSCFGEEEEKIIRFYLPLLSAPPTHDSLELFEKISLMEVPEKERIFKKNLALPVIQRLVEFEPEERNALYPLILPLSQNKQKELLENIQEISLRDKSTVSEILGDDRLQSILNSERLSPLQKADKVRQILQKRRFPLYFTRKEAFDALKKTAGWPADIKISPTPYFEEEKKIAEFSFLSRKDFLKKLTDLHRVAAQMDFAGLFEVPSDE